MKNSSKFCTSGPKFRGGGGHLPSLPDASYGPGCTWQLIGSLSLGYQLIYRRLLYMATDWFSQPRLSAHIPWVAVHGNWLVLSVSVISSYTVSCCTWQLIGSLSLGYQLIYRELLYMATDWFSQPRLSAHIRVAVYGNWLHHVLLKNLRGKLNFKVFVRSKFNVIKQNYYFIRACWVSLFINTRGLVLKKTVFLRGRVR